MNASPILALLQAALSLLLAVQSNTSLSPSLTATATQLAQQAITEAMAALGNTSQNPSVTSAPAQPTPTTQLAPIISESTAVPSPASGDGTNTSPAQDFSWLHFCPIILPAQCSMTSTPVYDPYGCVTAYTCAPSSAQNSTQLPAATTNTTNQNTTNTNTANTTAQTQTTGGSCVANGITYENGNTISYDMCANGGCGLSVVESSVISVTCNGGQWTNTFGGAIYGPTLGASPVVSGYWCGVGEQTIWSPTPCPNNNNASQGGTTTGGSCVNNGSTYSNGTLLSLACTPNQCILGIGRYEICNNGQWVTPTQSLLPTPPSGLCWVSSCGGPVEQNAQPSLMTCQIAQKCEMVE